jgi:hypothetical protein
LKWTTATGLLRVGGKREREGGFDVLLVGDGIPWSCDAVGGADVDATGVESVAVARDQLEPGGVDCVVCGTGAGTDAVAALAGVDPGVPVVAVVESGADADRAVAAGADETCRVDDSATTLARRIDGVVVDARTALGTGEAVTGADPSREGFVAIAPDWRSARSARVRRHSWGKPSTPSSANRCGRRFRGRRRLSSERSSNGRNARGSLRSSRRTTSHWRRGSPSVRSPQPTASPSSFGT